MSKTDITIYEYEMSYVGASYENPRKETWENYKERKGFITDQEAIHHLNAWGGQYFIGTQAEYDVLYTVTENYISIDRTRTLAFRGTDFLKNGKVVFDDSSWLTITRIKEVDAIQTMYYELKGRALSVTWQWKDYLIGNKNGVTPILKNLVSDDDANLLDKSSYEILLAKNIANDKVIAEAEAAKKAFESKVSYLKSDSSPKIAAYIEKGGDYLNLHGGDVKAVDLSEYIGANGKLSTKLVQIAVEGHKEKDKSIGLLVQVYDKFIMAIETGTEYSLKLLPFDTPTELNAEVDRLWKIENDKERKELSVKLNIPMDHFAIIDKYLMVVQGDEPEVAASPVPVKKSRKKTK